MRAHLSLVLAEKGSGVYTIPSNATVLEAVREMNAKGVGALLVIEQGSVAGIFTERDVLRRIVDQGRDAATTQVSSVMTPEVMSVSPTTTVGEAMSLMTRERVRHLPVLAGDELRGLVSIGDLTRWLVRDQQDEIDHLVSYITGRVP